MSSGSASVEERPAFESSGGSLYSSDSDLRVDAKGYAALGRRGGRMGAYNTGVWRGAFCVSCLVCTVMVVALVYLMIEAGRVEAPIDAGVINGDGGAGSMTIDQKRQAVVDAFEHGFSNYRTYAWGSDELRPVTREPFEWMEMGLTLLSSLDTMLLMGLEDSEMYTAAHTWVRDGFDLPADRHVSVFECNIRVLGSLLGAYTLTEDALYLDRAREVGDALSAAFDATPSGLPARYLNLVTGDAQNDTSVIAEVGTMQLEFVYLSQLTGDPTYADKAMAVFDFLVTVNPPNGLFPMGIDPATGDVTWDWISFGGGADSLYEYFLKVWLLRGKDETGATGAGKAMYHAAMGGVHDRLLQHSTPSGYAFLADYESWNGTRYDQMGHLACFAAAMFALGDLHNVGGPYASLHSEWATDLGLTCYQMYARSNTRISPEAVRFSPGDGDVDFVALWNNYVLRPETMESMFCLWRVTGDEVWRENGWMIFEAIDKICRTPNGFSGVSDVTVDPSSVSHDNEQQAFFFSETLKYAFLLFSDDTVLPLDQYVFNTEAHPFKIGVGGSG